MEEKQIEDEMEQSVPLDSILNRARKTRAISLIIAEFDLNMLKKRAEQELYKTVSLARESEADYS